MPFISLKTGLNIKGIKLKFKHFLRIKTFFYQTKFNFTLVQVIRTWCLMCVVGDFCLIYNTHTRTLYEQALNHLLILQTGAPCPWKPMPWSSWPTSFVLMLMLEEVWNSAVRLSRVFVTIPSLSCVTLSGLLLCGWVAVFLKHFQFAVIPITAYLGIYKKEYISQTGLLQQLEVTEL